MHEYVGLADYPPRGGLLHQDDRGLWRGRAEMRGDELVRVHDNRGDRRVGVGNAAAAPEPEAPAARRGGREGEGFGKDGDAARQLRRLQPVESVSQLQVLAIQS